MVSRSWAVRACALAIVGSLSLAACGDDDGAGVRTIDEDSSSSGSASGSDSGSTASEASGSASGSVEAESE